MGVESSQRSNNTFFFSFFILQRTKTSSRILRVDTNGRGILSILPIHEIMVRITVVVLLKIRESSKEKYIWK